jgi:tight adherence protein B
MKPLRLMIEAAGLARYSPTQLLFLVISSALILASWVQLSFEVLGLTIFSALATLGTSLEALRLRAKQRSDQLAKLWPEVLDSLQSAASSGFGIVDSLDEVSRGGPSRIRPAFQELVRRIDSGFGMDQSLDWFKSHLGQIQADRFVELIRIVNRSGGSGYLDSLRDQALRTRSEIALWAELDSKQGWVTGTAKLAIVAPWIVVATLAARAENVAIYNTAEGTAVLIVGLLVSLIAYRMVGLLGSLSKPSRVLTK